MVVEQRVDLLLRCGGHATGGALLRAGSGREGERHEGKERRCFFGGRMGFHGISLFNYMTLYAYS